MISFCAEKKKGTFSQLQKNNEYHLMIGLTKDFLPILLIGSIPHSYAIGNDIDSTSGNS